MKMTRPDLPLNQLRAVFGDRLQENVSLADYTTARTGGLADAFLPVHTAADLAQAVSAAWELGVPCTVLGGGSNCLVSDEGLRELVLLNRARNTRIDTRTTPPTAWAESGANFSALARQAALRGLAGLEWAAAVPGTVGGAVFGNAGAFGGDVRGSLLLAEILHPERGRETWPVERLEYHYRSSVLKREKSQAVILSAVFHLTEGDKAAIQASMEANTGQRQRTQPPGASMGSMFKNPEGDYAGRLVDACGLKGRRIGGAEISPVHANFFVNLGQATASDIWQLIQLAHNAVLEQHGINLELEIELLGPFEPMVSIHRS
ncbi:MAG TPA: UDP-N-acetylmuramate dehydrogenase [Anaerolineaceae bacterium]|nr:UDP-N-acetylmuramate dehydrogenase [Anaerolineaceae bacterium]